MRKLLGNLKFLVRGSHYISIGQGQSRKIQHVKKESIKGLPESKEGLVKVRDL